MLQLRRATREASEASEGLAVARSRSESAVREAQAAGQQAAEQLQKADAEVSAVFGVAEMPP